MDHVNKGIPKLVSKNQVDDKIEINYEQIYRICFLSLFLLSHMIGKMV